METAALVAPVTALEFLDDTFLLTGGGPVLAVYSLQPRPKAAASLTVLQHYRIHGVRPRASSESSITDTHRRKEGGLSSASKPTSYDLAVFGGKAVRLVRLHVQLHDGEHLRLEILGPLMELQDWALDVRWLSEAKRSLLCVAVAHNGALLLDITAGIALAQRYCVEGCLLYSALLLAHGTWDDAVLVGGTVFNQLVLWKPGGGGEEGSNKSDHKAPVERRLLGHSGVIFSISYLQARGLLASASDDRSVRVWAVGDLGGPGGKCGDINPACLRVLFGHQARVFSVRLSPGEVFSAGEDGACLVWDWARGGTVVHTLKGHRAGGVRALAISGGTGDEATRERWVATGGADGGVRLWRVEESEERKEKMEESPTEKLTDLEFCGRGVPKVVCIVGEEDDDTSWGQCVFVVCTDQGTVYQHRDGQWKVLWEGSPEFQSYCVMETVAVNVKDSAERVNLCAVGNLSGSIQVFPVSRPHCRIRLAAGSGKIHSLIWQEAEKHACLLASGAEGLVYRWRIKVRSDESCSLSVSALPPFLLPPCAKRWLTAAVRLHSPSQGALWVCGDRRGSLLLFQEGERVAQKGGDEVETREASQTDMKQAEENGGEEVQDHMLRPLSCLFGVHGKQGVTSVHEYRGLLYSTGRDGCVRVFRVHQTPLDKPEGSGRDMPHLEVLRVQRACRGMEWLERVLILNPEVPEEEEEQGQGEEEVGNGCDSPYETRRRLAEELEVAGEGKTENEGREARFVILGFHAAHFVVWDPVRQERLLAVPCGGGHRSWSLWPFHKGVWPGYGALVFIKQGAVLASQPPGEAPSWAGRSARAGGWGLREGIHGRGIGCVCRLGRVMGIGNEVRARTGGKMTGIVGCDEEREAEGEEGHWEVVVTGGEDTSVTVLAARPSSGSVKVLSVITDHISGVRAMAAVTRAEESGGQSPSLSALLVSASGRAQLQCYRLLIGRDQQRSAPSCQVIQVASHRLDEHWERRRNRHKMVKMDPETRYMSMAVVDERTDGVILALACSDGAVRLFSVSEVKHQIDLLWETFYHQRCVLSVATCSLEDGKGNRYTLLLSAATDGKIAVWDLTAAASFVSTSSPGGAPTPPIPCLDIPAHQSGVNALAVWVEREGQRNGGCLVTVPSGGDDGQLTVSTLRVQFPEEVETGGSRGSCHNPADARFRAQSRLRLGLHSQSRLPLAHAAPLTALKLLRPGLIVTTSSDQRVRLWRVDGTGIRHRGVLCSHVADAAALAVWSEQAEEEEEEEDEKRKTRFECEQEADISGGRRSQTGLETMGETGGRTSNVRGECEEAAGETGDPISEIRDEAGKARERGNQRDASSRDQSARPVDAGAGCKSGRGDGGTGWVLVCGQGLQLLRVGSTETGEGAWPEDARRGQQTVRVTLQERSTKVE